MPFHTAQHKIPNGESPRCWECDKPYVLPSGSGDIPPPSTQRARLQSQNNEIAKLKKELAAEKAKKDAPANDKAEEAPKQDLKKLQAHLEVSKQLGCHPSILEALEAQIQQTKDKSQKTGDDLVRISQQLKAAKDKLQKSVDKVLKIEGSLKEEKNKALECSEAVIKLEREEKRLIEAKGFVAEDAAAKEQALPIVPPCADRLQKQNWAVEVEAFEKRQQEEKQAFSSKLLLAAAEITAAAAPRAPPSLPPAPGATGGGESTDVPMQEAPPIPTEQSNKQRKDNDGKATPADPKALSEQQQHQQETTLEQKQKQQEQQAIRKEAEASLANLLKASSVRVGDTGDA